MRRFLVLLAAFPALLAAQSASRPAARGNNGFSSERLRRADEYLQQQVDSNRIGGAVVLVLRDGKVVYERGVGWADREARRPMTTDAIFRIASESKPVTSVAILQLAEAGKLSVDDAVSRWLPTFARTFVASDALGDSG